MGGCAAYFFPPLPQIGGFEAPFFPFSTLWGRFEAPDPPPGCAVAPDFSPFSRRRYRPMGLARAPPFFFSRSIADFGETPANCCSRHAVIIVLLVRDSFRGGFGFFFSFCAQAEGAFFFFFDCCPSPSAVAALSSFFFLFFFFRSQLADHWTFLAPLLYGWHVPWRPPFPPFVTEQSTTTHPWCSGCPPPLFDGGAFSKLFFSWRAMASMCPRPTPLHAGQCRIIVRKAFLFLPSPFLLLDVRGGHAEALSPVPAS